MADDEVTLQRESKTTDAEMIAWANDYLSESDPLAYRDAAIVKSIRDRLASLTPTHYRSGGSDKQHAAWLADKIHTLGDYAKEAAAMLNGWPEIMPTNAQVEDLTRSENVAKKSENLS